MRFSDLDLWTGTSAMRRVNRRARLALLHGQFDRRTMRWIEMRSACLMFAWGIE